MRGKAAIIALLAAWPAATLAQDPLSVIEWLNPPAEDGLDLPLERLGEDPVTQSARVPEIEIMPLNDTVSVSSVGLLASNVTGFPVSLWRASSATAVSQLLSELRTESDPVMTALLLTLLLAEAEAPSDDGGAAFLQARIQKLLELGAVEAAEALLARAGPEDSALRVLEFEIALLIGRPGEVCARINAAPSEMQDLGARIYCAARGGDWETAALMLDTGLALGALPARTGHLLLRFLDSEASQDVPLLPPGPQPDALQVRLYEAIGEALPASSLPRRFAVADLSGDAGWKAQLEAAERLTAIGVLSENRLLGIYTDRRAAASGGIWDRVAAVQRLDAAMASGDTTAIGTALQQVWPRMKAVRLDTAFARLYGPDLLKYSLSDNARRLAVTIALLSPDYEIAARSLAPDAPDAALLRALASGAAPDPIQTDPMLVGVAAGFSSSEPPRAIKALYEDGKLGEAILKSMHLLESGTGGNARDLSGALLALRAVGLEDIARRVAIRFVLSREGQ